MDVWVNICPLRLDIVSPVFVVWPPLSTTPDVPLVEVNPCLLFVTDSDGDEAQLRIELDEIRRLSEEALQSELASNTTEVVISSFSSMLTQFYCLYQLRTLSYEGII